MRGARQGKQAFFWTSMFSLGLLYILLIVMMLAADAAYWSPSFFWQELSRPTVRYSLQLSLISSGISTILSLWIAVPTAYVLSRWRHLENQRLAVNKRGFTVLRLAVEGILDIPIVLPPLVIGISLLVLFQTTAGQCAEQIADQLSLWLGRGPGGITFEASAIIVAQTMVVTAYSIQMLRQVYNEISLRSEQVARTLGASRWQAFMGVVFPQLRSGMVATGTMAFAKSLGEFGPILVFAGMTPMKTEVLPTSIYLNFQKGDLAAAVSLSMVMILFSLMIMIGLRWLDLYQDSPTVPLSKI